MGFQWFSSCHPFNIQSVPTAPSGHAERTGCDVAVGPAARIDLGPIKGTDRGCETMWRNLFERTWQTFGRIALETDISYIHLYRIYSYIMIHFSCWKTGRHMSSFHLSKGHQGQVEKLAVVKCFASGSLGSIHWKLCQAASAGEADDGRWIDSLRL